MLDVTQFRKLIIDRALTMLDLHSEAAAELLLGTAIQESGLRYLQQLGNGPALGLFQMEPTTHDDIWLNFLAYREDLSDKLRAIDDNCDPWSMVGNLWYAAAMCRIHYLRAPDSLPAAGALNAQAVYWKRHYNTPLGAGTAAEYVANWNRLMGAA